MLSRLMGVAATAFMLTAGRASADDSCPWARDGECDEPGLGTGLCEFGTDSTDCRGGTAASCPWTNDGECDEPEGTNLCPEGTDVADCRGGAPVDPLNSCAHAFDGTCDEPGLGTGICAAGTDHADCLAEGTVLPPFRPVGGHDSCALANNGDCNEQPHGTGCPALTDETDCAIRPQPPVSGENSCRFAYDGQCDEPEGTQRCLEGTDTADCSRTAAPQLIPEPGDKPGNNSCAACDCNNVSPTDLDCVLCCHDAGAPPDGDGVCDGTPFDPDCTVIPQSVPTVPSK